MSMRMRTRTRTRTRPRTVVMVAATLAASVLVLGPGAVTTASAFFTVQAVTPAQQVGAAELRSLTGATAEHDGTGVATVAWNAPTVRTDIDPDYTIERSLDGTTSSLTPTLDTSTGTTGFTDDLTVPSAIAGKTVTAISAGASHSCAIAEGAAYCWGSSGYGPLGNNSTENSGVPVAVNTSGVLAGKTVTAISAGTSLSCAIADAAVYCWGYGEDGRLGNNSDLTWRVPVAVHASGVLSGKAVTAISAGGSHSCAIAEGAAYCWGYGEAGRLGNNSSASSSVPVAVDTSGVLSGKVLTAISVGDSHSCAIESGGAVYCWGNGGSGRLGNNSTASSSVPVAVDTSGVLAGKAATAISVGDSHSCAIESGGAVYCWGYGGSGGQLGNNSTANSSVPVAVDTSGVLAGKAATAISAGNYHSCTIADGAASCWGDGGYGQLGNDINANSYSESSVPVAVDTSGVLLGNRVCATGWLLTASTHCAPGPNIPVSYTISYTTQGWSPPTSTLTAATWKATP